MTSEADPAPRQRWLAILARAPRAALEEALERAEPPRHDLVRPPECGMVMLRGRTGGTGAAFNVGEVTVTRCAARIGAWLGVGYLLGRDLRRAECIALLDALLQDPARRQALLRDVVEPLAQAQSRERERRSREAAASRVEFFTMVRGDA